MYFFPWLRGEVSGMRILAIDFVCFYSFLFSFLFLFLPTFSIFSPLLLPLISLKSRFGIALTVKKYVLMPWLVLDQTHKLTQTREVRSREKAERTQRAVRRFTRFVDYGLMFDSRRSFSLEYKLIRSPYKKSLEL